MNKRIKKKKARRRPFLPCLIEAMERYVNGWRHETTRAKKRRVQQENKARRQERMAKIPTYKYGDMMNQCRRWVHTLTPP